MKKSTSRTGQNEDVRKLPTFNLRNANPHRSFVLYGRSGTGKSTLASTFPKPILYLDIRDKGTDSISDIDGILGMEIEEFDDFEMVYYYLKKHPKEYKSVVIDTVTQLQQLAQEEQSQRRGKDVSRAGHWGTLTKQDYGDIAAKMKEWIIRYRDLPLEVCFIAQDRNFNFDDAGGDDLEPEVGPALSPATAKTLNAAVTMIGNTYIYVKTVKKEINGKKVERDTIQFRLRVGPNPVYTTKIRKPRKFTAPEFIVNPSYEDIIAVIEGEE